MAKYRKKPVVIDAIRWVSDNLEHVIEFVDGSKPDMYGSWARYVDITQTVGFKISTLEGVMTVQLGDWIIRGVKGEYYPCKPDIFDSTYEPVADDSHVCIGDAMAALKKGKRVHRKAWNGGTLYLIQGSNDFASMQGYGFGELVGEPRFDDILFIHSGDNRLLPWCPTQADLLANDWAIR